MSGDASVPAHIFQPSVSASCGNPDKRSVVRQRRSQGSSQATEPLIQADRETEPHTDRTNIDADQSTSQRAIEPDDSVDEEIMKYGASHVVRLFIPVSICMSLVVVSISAIKYYTVKEPGQFFIYTPFSESDQADSGRIALVSLMNALVFIGVVLTMTILLILLYKYRCYAIIHGWLVLSTLLLLFMFAFIYVAEMIKALNIAADWISLCLVIWNFGVAGLCAIHWKAPLHLQQAYHISMSVLMALVLIKWLPDWTGWVILGTLAIYDLIAVLCPCGPLNILVKTAKERNENVFPALIYSSGMVRVGKPGGRFGESSNPAVPDSAESYSGTIPVSASAASANEADQLADSYSFKFPNTAVSDREHAALLATMAGSPPKTVASQLRAAIPLIEGNPLSLVVTVTDSDEASGSKQLASAGSSKQRASASAKHVGVKNSAAEFDSSDSITQAQARQAEVDREQAENTGMACGSRSQIQMAASSKPSTPRIRNAAAAADNIHEQVEIDETTRDTRWVSATQSQESQLSMSSESKDRGVKMGLGDFIFYSVLVGKAAQQSGDWTTTIICFVAILIGLGCTLILLAIFRRALPALPISIAFGLTFFFASSYILLPFVDTLAVNQVFI